MSDQFILSVDQGTTSSRALAFDTAGQVRTVVQREFRQIFPDDGWVSMTLEIWDTTMACCKDVLAELGAENFAAIAIANQRETAVMGARDRQADFQCDCLARPPHGGNLQWIERGRS